MRFSTTATVAALGAFSGLQASAESADSPDYVAQFQSQFQDYLGQAQEYYQKFSDKVPSPNKFDPVGAAEAKVGEMRMHTLTLDNWEETLFEPVSPATVDPETWWVLVTGGNRTCYGGCENIEKAFNQSAAKLALLPNAPHVGLLNCEKQPVLCAGWSAAHGHLYAMEMLPRPAPINIYGKRLNGSTITSEELGEMYTQGHRSWGFLLESMFHPFDGLFAQNGLTVPVGYALWAFGLIPSWAFMLGVSMFSRTFMGNRVAAQQARNAPNAPAQ